MGLSGGIASGKSAVATQLASRLPLIDLDILAREVVEPNTSALKQIQAHFGDSVIGQDGALDRARLGDIVFRDVKQRHVLNGIVHPAIRKLLARRLLGYWLSGHKICVVDAPLLIEAGLWKFCGCIIIVYWWAFLECDMSWTGSKKGYVRSFSGIHNSSERLQLERLMKRNGLSADAAQSRLDAQNSLSSKLVYADYVIDNSGTLSELHSQVDTVVRKLQRDAGWSWRLSWLLPPYGILSAVFTILYRLYVKVGLCKFKMAKFV